MRRLALAAVLSPLQAVAQDAPGSAQNIFVIDGDTVVHKDESVRLIGCDAPEIFRARCQKERETGEQAARRLRDLLAQSRDARIDPKVNWRGLPRRDRHCRVLAWLRIDGKDACCTLIEEGLAVPYDGRGKRIDWCDEAQIGARPRRCLTPATEADPQRSKSGSADRLRCGTVMFSDGGRGLRPWGER